MLSINFGNGNAVRGMHLERQPLVCHHNFGNLASSGILMTNNITETNLEEAVPCFALSKNDSYVMSASGGKISLFNMMTFKTMTTFMPPPPAATFLAFHPQDNNVIAIGMEDSSIQIYNVRVDEVKIKLKGHQKKITGLPFSSVLNILVSSAADTQRCLGISLDLQGLILQPLRSRVQRGLMTGFWAARHM